MFRRLLATFALVATAFVSAPSLVHAETGGGVDSTTKSSMAQIASGDRHTCIVVNTRVACWGSNGRYQLGDGTSTDRNMATFVPNVSNVEQVAASERNTCVLITGGSVKCWGDNTYGQLGNGTAGSGGFTLATVCAVGGCGSGILTGATHISLGFGFACAILADATVACWGTNSTNQIGSAYPAVTTSTTPLAVGGVTGATSIVSGDSHTCALVAGGAMKCWGLGTRGQLGDGGTSSSTPVSVNRSGVTAVTAIAATKYATCAIVSASKVKCWGGDSANEMGYDTGNPSPNTYPTDATGLFTTQTPVTPQLSGTDLTAKAIDGGPRGVCIISLTNSLACWGSIAGLGMATGGINFGAAFSSNWVSGMTSTTNVAVSTSTVCATNSSTLKCWGAGPFGELGDAGGSGGNSPMAAVSVVVPTSQTISFPAIDAQTTAMAPVTLGATSSAGVPVSYVSNSPSVCSVSTPSSSTIATMLTPGTCSITASNAGGNFSGTWYAPASDVTVTFAVTNVKPVVTLNAASSITTTGAVLSTSVNAAQLSTSTYFLYGTSSSLTGATRVNTTTVTGQSDSTVSTTLTGLAPGTKYYYTISATNSVGETKPATQSFTTLGAIPSATTGSPTSVSSGRATLNGVANANDVATSVWFTIGQKSDLSDGTKIDFREITGNTSTDVSVSALNLTESVRYYYRIEASNSLGSVKGDIKSFTAARPTGISVNDAAEFTNKKQVTIFATGPSGATQVIISNDGGFKSSETFSLTDNYAEIPWNLVASRDERLPKTVYARFVQRFGTQSSNYSDDIILDTTAPVMTSTTGAATAPASDNVTVQAVGASAAKGAVRLTVKAKDVNSGIGKVQVKGSSGGSPVDVATGSPKATTRTVKVNTTKKKLWVRVVDRAGNVSKWVTVTVK